MSIIEQATRRLEQLAQAGIAVPWSAAKATRATATAGQQVAGSDPKQPDVVQPVLPMLPPVLPAAGPAAAIPAPTKSRQKAPPRPAPTIQVEMDLKKLRDTGYLVPDQVRSDLAQQFRHLKRPLLKNAHAKVGTSEHRGTLIMVTSAMAGEGKTYCSINLAMSMAMEVDTAVLLVDADVVRPSVFDRLGIKAEPPGLLDLLTRDDFDLHEARVATNVPKLFLMSAGALNERSTELLASASMDRLLARLAVEYSDHIIIFDAPPLLLTTESSVLASKVGQVLVVVEALKTPRHAVQQAFAALRSCPVVLSVLNKFDDPSEHGHYGYYYR